MSLPASSLYQPVDLRNQCVLITGASSGIGRSTALRFAELGCRLAFCGRRTDRLVALKGDIKKMFPGAPEPIAITLDVSDMDSVSKLPTRLADQGMYEVDILVNNAGFAAGSPPVDEIVLGRAQELMATNVLAVMALTRLFTPGMKARGRGHIVNVSSVAGHEAYQGGSVYCASKSAVNAFTTAARHDLCGTPIRVTAISPGMVETEFSKVRYDGDEFLAAKTYEGIVPMVADDIADQIIYATTRPSRVQVADVVSYATNQGHARYVVERKGPSMGAPHAAATNALLNA